MSDLHSIPPLEFHPPHTGAGGSPRRAILDLAPLELECLHALWSLAEEASVRDVRAFLLPTCPRAYTTIMTILDRLAHKALVTRRKSGRAWLYTPNLSADEARSSAVGKLVEHFFSGSEDSLRAHLSIGEGGAAGGRIAEATIARLSRVRHKRESRDERPERVAGNKETIPIEEVRPDPSRLPDSLL